MRDAEARARAIDPSRSVIVQAPAGSGKTTLLTLRLLALLARVDAPEEILAITFTRKAAAEMFARVQQALRLDIDPEHPMAATLRSYAEAALAVDASRGWQLAAHPSRLRIQTIDALNHAIASERPVASGAGARLAIADRPTEFYERAVEQLLIDGAEDEALAADLDLVFERLDNRTDRVARLLVEMLARRGHWLRHVTDGEQALCARVADSLAHVVGATLVRATACIPRPLLDDAEDLEGVGPLAADPETLPGWQRLAGLVLTREDRFRRQLRSHHLGPAFGTDAAKSGLRAIISALARVDGAESLLAEVRRLPPAALSDREASALAALARILRAGAASLQVEFTVAGKVDYTYVAGAARAALTEQGEPTDQALRAGLGLRHILVDEFQDTSLGQFELLANLTAAWEPGDGRTLFVVGDPMQSIYLFREAEVGLFLRARDRGIGRVRLEALRLESNFRSDPVLVDFVNATFTSLFPARDDLGSGAVAYAASEAARPHAADACVHLLCDADATADDGAARVLARIRRLRETRPGDSIAVLVAGRDHAVPITRVLVAAGIPVAGLDLLPLADVPAVGDLVALARALEHPSDRTAWVAVLRAPYCGLGLATLTMLVPDRAEAPLLARLRDLSPLDALPAEERARAVRVAETLDDAMARRGREPFADLLEHTWARLGGPEACDAHGRTNARVFLEGLAARLGAGDAPPAREAAQLAAELHATPAFASRDAVEIMTLHRAKGLEFDHVILPALERAPRADTGALLRWLDLPAPDGGTDLLMSPIAAIEPDASDPLGAFLRRRMAERAAYERTRLLYVGATRAIRSLTLVAAPRRSARSGELVRPARSPLAALWPALGEGFMASEPERRIQTSSRSRAPLRRLPPDWTPPEPSAGPALARIRVASYAAAAPEFSWVGETARWIGTIVHEEFERLAALDRLPAATSHGLDDRALAARLARAGVPGDQVGFAVRSVREAVERTLADERGRWVLGRHASGAASELALTGLVGGRLESLRVDRTFVDDDGIRWVIDFKTGRHEGGDVVGFLDRELERYRAQLDRYRALASSLGPQPVRAALYFPLVGAFKVLDDPG
jgi:ATP-dependent exoDNAse (exonuclease V) beta subunit